MGAEWLFGLDGGGTSARLRIESVAGELLFYAEGGSSNPRSRPREAVQAELAALFARAREEAGIGSEDCVAGFAGSAGVDRPADRGAFVELLRRAASLSAIPRVEAGNDAEPALAGALFDTEGMLLIAGTGAIAYARSRDGFSVRAGGWGHLLGDEGSAFRLAFDALSRGLRSMEGRDLPTLLLDDALEFFAVEAPADLLPLVYDSLDKTRIARFARVVGRRRDSGDALAIDLFDKAAEELAALVVSVHGRIASRLERKRLAFRGGLIEGDERLRSEVKARIAAALPGVEMVAARADASVGACILARALLR